MNILPRICYRINIIGDYRCGKTTVFENNSNINIGATTNPEINTRYYNYNNENYCFMITDTPGHSSYNRVNECYYDNYDCLIIVVDMSSDKNFLNLPFLIEKVESKNKNYNSNDKTVILVGNLKDKQLISDNKLIEYADMYNFNFVKYTRNDSQFYEKIFQTIINNKKNGKQKKRNICLNRLNGCFTILN